MEVRKFLKGAILAAVAITIIVLALAFGPPVSRGWHLGFNAATDEACETRLGLQWCGHTGERAANKAAEEQAHEEARAEQRHREEAEAPARKAKERQEAEEFDRQTEANKRQSERENAEVEGRRPCEERESKGEAC